MTTADELAAKGYRPVKVFDWTDGPNFHEKAKALAREYRERGYYARVLHHYRRGLNSYSVWVKPKPKK